MGKLEYVVEVYIHGYPGILHKIEFKNDIHISAVVGKWVIIYNSTCTERDEELSHPFGLDCFLVSKNESI